MQNEKTTRERLIDAAFDEIYSHGYQGAALVDILAKAEVHKGSMYHFFANKKELALAAINEKITERFFERYGAITSLEGGYLDIFFQGLKDLSQRDFKRGCPVANIVQEMSNLDEDFNDCMKTIYAEFRKSVKTIFDKAVEVGEMEPNDTQKLALFTTATLEGAILSAKASGDAQDYLSVIEGLIEYINVYIPLIERKLKS